VARKISTGTCSIYSSWENYQSESKASTTTSPSSPKTAKKKKEGIEDNDRSTEVAAFPTMAQAIAYIKNLGRQSPESTPKSKRISSVRISPATNLKVAGRRKDDPKSSADAIPADDSTDRRKRNFNNEKKAIEVIDVEDDCYNDSSNVDRAATHAKSVPSPIPSESPTKKRKTEAGTSSSISSMVSGRLFMSKTSETIDIGDPTSSKPDTSSLAALATLASASGGKKGGKPQQPEKSRALTPSDAESAEEIEKANAKRTIAATLRASNLIVEEARKSPTSNITRDTKHDTSPREIILPGVKQLSGDAMERLTSRLSPSILAAVSQKQREKLIQHQREEQEIYRLQQEKEKLQFKSLTSSLVIPKVPTTSITASLKIPEVPRGFLSTEHKPDRISRAISDLKSSIDRKIRMQGPTVPSMGMSSLSSTQAISNRLSLDSYPLGSFPSQLQHLPRHLEGLQEASQYRTSPSLLSLQLQSSRKLLNHPLLNGASLLTNHQQQLQTIDLASTTSGTSEGGHSDITLKRRNGPAPEASSPIFQGKARSPIRLGTIYTNGRPDSPLQKTKRDHRNRL